MGGDRNWNRWKEAQGELHETYKVEEAYWSKRARVRWLNKETRTQYIFIQ